ncbi:hypothetical protein SNE40_011766 [Patella caerulea]|uniref:rRNA adenine N(6)-methyltransferase n=1 Tax=Patella caerulea TaxID=87958 RepID=A0AAN8JP10_PATCE
MAGVRLTRLPPLPTISEIIRIYRLQAKKKLSQNFLLDMNLNRKLVKKAGKLKDNLVIEVGPGPGGITRAILEKDIHSLVAIEKDRRFLPGLQLLADAADKEMRITQGDIMDFNLETLIPDEFKKPWEANPPNIHIIGNLPFNVSTPLIIKWLQAISEKNGAWKYGRTPLTLTFQKEVADRMVSPILTDHRCRLSVMCQHLCDVSLQFVIPGKAFTPQPKVDVGVVKFTPLIKPLIDLPFKLVEKLIRHIFQYRQKKCKHGAATLFPMNQQDLVTELFDRSGVSPDSRSFMITMEEFNRLCQVYNDICDRHPDIFMYNFRSAENAKAIRQKNHLQVVQFEKQILYGDPSDFNKDFCID